MPKRESLDNKTKKQPRESRNSEEVDGVPSEKTRQRVSRACDRCKLKKSKCDGASRCQNCIGSENDCRYSAKRRREARDWYWNMQEVMDQAIQQLYWACRQKTGFPGQKPDEGSGQVTTEDILLGLGLISRKGELMDADRNHNSSRGLLQAGRLLEPPDVAPSQVLPTPSSSTSPSRTLMMSQGSDPQSATSIARDGNSREPLPNSMMNFSMGLQSGQQHLHYTSSSDWASLVDVQVDGTHYDNQIDPSFPPMNMPIHGNSTTINGGYVDGISPVSIPNDSSQYSLQSMAWSPQEQVHPSVIQFSQHPVNGTGGLGWGTDMTEHTRKMPPTMRRK